MEPISLRTGQQQSHLTASSTWRAGDEGKVKERVGPPAVVEAKL